MRFGGKGRATVVGIPATAPVTVVTITSAPTPNLSHPGGTYQLTYLAQGIDPLTGQLFTITGRTPTYTSLTPSVATVDSNGLVTEVSAGTSVVRVTVDGVPAEITVTVTNPQSAVDHIDLSQYTMGLTSGNSGVLSAVVRDVLNQSLPGKVVAWSRPSGTSASVGSDSGDPNHQATVTAHATITGATNIIASCEGHDSAPCVITVAAPDPSHPNMPGGFTTIMDERFLITGVGTAIPNTNAWSSRGVGQSGVSCSFEVFADGSNPAGYPNVFRLTMPAGTYGGSSLMNWYKFAVGGQGSAGYRKYYGDMAFRIPDGSYLNNTESKISPFSNPAFFVSFFRLVPDSIANQNALLHGNFHLQPRIQNSSNGVNGCSINGGPLLSSIDIPAGVGAGSGSYARGAWVRIESLYVINTDTHEDGEWWVWLNGVLAFKTTVLRQTADNSTGANSNNKKKIWDGASAFPYLYFQPGGGSNVVPNTSYFDVAYIFQAMAA